MCLIVDLDSVPKIAEQDIVCYKVVCKDMTSPCWEFKYEVGKEYKTEIQSRPAFNQIYNGFHTFCNLKDAQNNINTEWVRKLNYNNIVKSSILLKCIIPKWSEYYKGYNCNIEESYVSSSIKVVEIIKNIEE